MKHLRDRLLLVFGGLVFIVMVVIIADEEYLNNRLLATVEKQRLALAGKVLAARLSAHVDAEAGRLMQIEVADARAIAGGGALPALPADESGDILVVLDAAGNPEGPPLQGKAVALARFAASVTSRREELLVLDDALYVTSVLPMKRRGKTLAVARPIDEDLAEILAETAAHGGTDDGMTVLLNRNKVLDVRASSTQASVGTLQATRETFAGLLSDPRIVNVGQSAGPADVLSLIIEGETWLAVPTLLVTRTRDDCDAWFVYLRPRAAVFAPVRERRQRTLVIGGVAVLVVLLVALFMSGRITRPLERLVHKMHAVSRGDLEQMADVEGRDEIAQLSDTFNNMTAGLRQKELLKRYVPVQAREMIETDRSARVVLGGRRVRITAMFSDIRGFTAMSERLDAEEVVSLVNAYLEAMIAIIHGNGGDVIDYVGDGIFAVFHDGEATGAAKAAQAALGMQAALERLRASSTIPHLSDLRMGIGIHTGPAVEGNLGTDERLKYGVVGDTVNVASRIQDRSRDGTHTCILMSDASRADAEGVVETVLFGDEMLKGKAAAMRLWEVVQTRVGSTWS